MPSRRPLAFLGVAIDSSGARRGDERGVAALRAAGLARLAGVRDGGDAPARISTSERDPATGVIGFADLRAATRALRERVAAVVGRDELPLVVGGDDSYLPGMLAGARDRLGRVGLAFVDGHLDAADGATSPTGEAADMGLAFALGGAPAPLADDLGGPAVAPGDVVALGSRLEQPWCPLPGGGLGREADLLDARVRVLRAEEVRAAGAARVGAELEARLAAGAPLWLHLDLDALDEAVMPAVSYPQPDGLSWDELADLAGPLMRSERLAGVDLACFNPDLDPGGALAERVVELVERLRLA